MKPRATVGIIGGGQLARMLFEAAARLGVDARVLAASSDDPAAQLNPSAVLGGLSDRVALRRFLAQVSIVLFESEFADVALLEEILEELRVAGLPVPRFVPGLEVIRTLQDKVSQKQLLGELGIPSAPFLVFDGNRAQLRAWIAEVNRTFSGQAVFKWARLGYDGKGTLIGPRPEREIEEFCAEALAKRVPLFAEKKISFTRELAIVSACGASERRSEFVAYPLVISEQRAGICRLVFGPAGRFGIPGALERQATEWARRIAERLELVGVHAIELFMEGEGSVARLWVNELAPRVHNSGHYTQDACHASQFENHVRAALELGLGEVRPAPLWMMRNLIASATPETELGARQGQPPWIGGLGRLHWYGKLEARPGRKMGHLNGRAETQAEFEELKSELERIERDWLGEADGEKR
jgi:5-(carboxyamino)imidazole ribonucleotide synthase